MKRSCSWCHEMNEEGICTCWNCGHRPDVSRADCDCPSCARTTVHVRQDKPQSGFAVNEDGSINYDILQ